MTKRLWNSEEFDFKFGPLNYSKLLKSFIDSEFEKYQERLIERVEKQGGEPIEHEDLSRLVHLDDVIRVIKNES